MKSSLLFFCLLISMASISADRNSYTQSNQAMIYYFDINIQRITGLSEEIIEKNSTLYYFDIKDFYNAVINRDDVGNQCKYESRDVRAKIIYLNHVYFVDRFKHFYGEGTCGELDIGILTKNLTSTLIK